MRTILIPRIDGVGVDTYAILKVETDRSRDDLESVSQILSAFKRAITKWVKETEDGKNAWEHSAEDLNIGDIACWITKELNSYLKMEGVSWYKITVGSSEDNGDWMYDTILVNRDELEEEEE